MYLFYDFKTFKLHDWQWFLWLKKIILIFTEISGRRKKEATIDSCCDFSGSNRSVIVPRLSEGPFPAERKILAYSP